MLMPVSWAEVECGATDGKPCVSNRLSQLEMRDMLLHDLEIFSSHCGFRLKGTIPNALEGQMVVITSTGNSVEILFKRQSFSEIRGEVHYKVLQDDVVYRLQQKGSFFQSFDIFVQTHCQN